MVPLLALLMAGAARGCTTWSSGACIIPYRVEGVLHTECMTRLSPDERGKERAIPMCPTRLGRGGEGEAWGRCGKDCPLAKYSTNDEIAEEVLALASSHPDIARPFSIGQSKRGTELLGIRISRGIRSRRESLKPMVRLVGNIHGNEAVGREVSLALARHLVLGYGVDSRLTRLIDTTDISLLPTANPDGFERAVEGQCSGSGWESGSYNSGRVNINQDFPTFADYQRFQQDYEYDPFEGRQDETKALMTWAVEEPWLLGASLHDGAVMVTYPWDRPNPASRTSKHLTADEVLFRKFSEDYVGAHPTMANSTCFRSLDGGVANAAQWNSANHRKGKVEGSMKDFSYMFSNCLELQLDLSCCKYPRPYFLLRDWEANKESLLGLLEQVHVGIKGLVFSEKGTPQEGADVITWLPSGEKWGKNVTTARSGEYWRMVIPSTAGRNTYGVQAVFADCEPGGSGRVFASLRHRVIVSQKNPLREQHMYLTQVGYCGITETPRDSTSVIADLVGGDPRIGGQFRAEERRREEERREQEERNRQRNRQRIQQQRIEDLIGNFFEEQLGEVEERGEPTGIAADAVLSVFEGV